MKYGADDSDTMIAGRKYYWHNNKAIINRDAHNKDGNNMEEKVQLVKAGSSFDFDIYFDKITETMLKKLAFSISFGNNPNNMHKIGHGKPLGLGSAVIRINKITVRDYINGKYDENDVSDIATSDGSIFENQSNVKNVLKATNFNTIPDGSHINYPHTSKNDDIFEWFTENRCSWEPGKPKFKSKLPRLTDVSQEINCNPVRKKGL